MNNSPKLSLATEASQSFDYLPKQAPKIISDFIAGSIAGLTTTFCGHPLDTIKVRMQVLDQRFWSCVRSMVKYEGVRSLYKGIQSPLMSTPFVTAISFGSYELSKKLLGIETNKKASFIQGLLAGGLAGFFYACFSTPIELVKCRLQMEGTGQKAKGSGTLKMITQTLKKEGPTGFYKGYGITCLRDIPGGAVQFGAYELYRDLLKNISEDQTTSNFIAGGLAKFTTWFVCYPQDLIKTKLQCKSGYQGTIDCCKEVWKKYGSVGFWRGSLPSIVKTIVSGSVSFTVYEEVKLFLSKF